MVCGKVFAKGFSQLDGESLWIFYAPVMSFVMIKFYSAHSALVGWEINQLDAKNAFLNGEIDYFVFLKPLDG